MNHRCISEFLWTLELPSHQFNLASRFNHLVSHVKLLPLVKWAVRFSSEPCGWPAGLVIPPVVEVWYFKPAVHGDPSVHAEWLRTAMESAKEARDHQWDRETAGPATTRGYAALCFSEGRQAQIANCFIYSFTSTDGTLFLWKILSTFAFHCTEENAKNLKKTIDFQDLSNDYIFQKKLFLWCIPNHWFFFSYVFLPWS